MINGGELFSFFLLFTGEECSVYRGKKCVLMLFNVCTWVEET